MSLTKFNTYRAKPFNIELDLKAFDLAEDIEFLKTLLPCGYDYLHAAKDYSYDCMVCVIKAILAKSLPELPAEEAALVLGQRAYNAMTKTVIGRVTMSVFHLISLERALEISIPALNKNIGFGHRKLVKLGPTHFRVECSDDPGATLPIMLNLSLGLARRMLETFKVEQPEVKIYLTGPLSYNLELKWKKPHA